MSKQSKNRIITPKNMPIMVFFFLRITTTENYLYYQ